MHTIPTWSPVTVQRLQEIASEQGVTLDTLLLEITLAYLETQETQAQADARHAEVLQGNTNVFSQAETDDMLSGDAPHPAQSRANQKHTTRPRLKPRGRRCLV